MVNGKQKGKAGELEWAKVCKEHGYDCRRSQQFCGANGDADVIGIEGLHMEVKRREQLQLPKWIEQAQNDAREGEIPIVAHRRNREAWIVSMDAESFFKLLSKE